MLNMASLQTPARSLVKRSLCKQSSRQLPSSSILSRQITTTSPSLRRTSLVQQPRSLPTTTPLTRISLRRHSSPASTSKQYNFEQVQTLSTSPQPSQILIDVREPSEYEAGYIPSAINIPVKSHPDAFFLTGEEFEERFGFEKPDPEKTEVVFYCKAGVRSNAAAQLAVQNGYVNVSEYRGSWMDWEKNGGKVERPYSSS